MVFCKKCLFTGLPSVVNRAKKIKVSCEICPNCLNPDNLEYYLDEASAEHAKAHFIKVNNKTLTTA